MSKDKSSQLSCQWFVSRLNLELVVENRKRGFRDIILSCDSLRPKNTSLWISFFRFSKCWPLYLAMMWPRQCMVFPNGIRVLPHNLVFRQPLSNNVSYNVFSQSPVVQSVALWTWEQEVACSIPGSVNILSESLRQNSFLFHHSPLFQQWLCGKAASGLKRILCGVLVDPLPDKKILDWSQLKQIADDILKYI